MKISVERKMEITLYEEEIDVFSKILQLAAKHLSASELSITRDKLIPLQAGLAGYEIDNVKSMITRMSCESGSRIGLMDMIPPSNGTDIVISEESTL